MAPMWVVLLALVGAIVVLVFHGIAIYLGAQMPAVRPGDRPTVRSYPRVTAIIAARNEEADLPACLDSLLAQEYPNLDVIVVDGGSTDRTREIVRTRFPTVRLIEEPPLPQGWVGKNWACWTGAQAATGEYLLFTDADMRYHPDAVRATVAWTLEDSADLTTLAPRIEMVGFWEKLILPFYTQVVLTYFRTPRVNREDSRTAMANGQFVLVSRSAYDAAGGHSAVRGAVLEDVRMAEEFRAQHRRLRVGWAPDLLSTRMYRDRREMFEGLLKNVHGSRFSAWRQAAFLTGLVGFFWAPLAVLPLGVLLNDVWLIGIGTVLYIALFGKHVGFTWAVRGSPSYGLLFPLAAGFYVVLVGSSLRRGIARAPLRWKGREYPIDA